MSAGIKIPGLRRRGHRRSDRPRPGAGRRDVAAPHGL